VEGGSFVISKLFALKEWLTLDDASAYLSSLLEEQVTVRALLQFAVQNEIRLSVRIVHSAPARKGAFKPIAEARFAPSLVGLRSVILDDVIDENTVVRFDHDPEHISGVFDFHGSGAERVLLEELYAIEAGMPSIGYVSLNGIYLQSVSGDIYELRESFVIPPDSEEAKRGELPTYGHMPVSELTSNMQLVVRPLRLQEFVGRITAASDVAVSGVTNGATAEPPQSQKLSAAVETKERNTLLCIIASLCKEAKIDYKKPSKAAGLIREIAHSQLGVAIGDSTIEGHLNKIPSALESRAR
jgi:hypothetical protein